MTVYAIAQITIHDRARYQRYAAAFMPILEAYGGRLLAADERPEVVEGTWPHQKVILIAFDDRAHYERWANSAEYQRVSEDRRAATVGVSLLVHGLAAPA